MSQSVYLQPRSLRDGNIRGTSPTGFGKFLEGRRRIKRRRICPRTLDQSEKVSGVRGALQGGRQARLAWRDSRKAPRIRRGRRGLLRAVTVAAARPGRRRNIPQGRDRSPRPTGPEDLRPRPQHEAPPRQEAPPRTAPGPAAPRGRAGQQRPRRGGGRRPTVDAGRGSAPRRGPAESGTGEPVLAAVEAVPLPRPQGACGAGAGVTWREGEVELEGEREGAHEERERRPRGETAARLGRFARRGAPVARAAPSPPKETNNSVQG